LISYVYGPMPIVADSPIHFTPINNNPTRAVSDEMDYDTGVRAAVL